MWNAQKTFDFILRHSVPHRSLSHGRDNRMNYDVNRDSNYMNGANKVIYVITPSWRFDWNKNAPNWGHSVALEGHYESEIEYFRFTLRKIAVYELIPTHCWWIYSMTLTMKVSKMATKERSPEERLMLKTAAVGFMYAGLSENSPGTHQAQAALRWRQSPWRRTSRTARWILIYTATGPAGSIRKASRVVWVRGVSEWGRGISRWEIQWNIY